MKHGARIWYAGAAVVGALAGCSSSDFAAGDDLGIGASSGTGGTASLPPGMQQPEPEQEADEAFQVPVVSGRWVWTANPTSGVVALIDASSFAVKTVAAGAGPTYLAALPVRDGDESRAVVINSISEDATVLRSSADGTLEVGATLPLHGGANAWAITSDGRFAIAWTNAATTDDPDPSEGFQDITVLSLDEREPRSKRLSVGYRPARVFMDDDDRYAYVVTDAGIDVVDLAAPEGPIVERELALSANPARDTARRDVNVTPDGAWALVSRQDEDYLTVVNIADGTFKEVRLPGVVTDLDLSADGSMAIAVVQQTTSAADHSAEETGGGGHGGQTEGASEEGGAGAETSGGGELGFGGGAAGHGGGAGAADGGGTVGQRSVALLLPVATLFDAPDRFQRVDIEERFASVELGPDDATGLLYQNGVPNPRLTLLSLLPEATEPYRTVDLKLPVFSALATPDGAHGIAILEPPADAAKPGAFAVVPIARDLPAVIQGTAAPTVPTDAVAQAPAMVAIADGHAVVTVSDGASVHVAYLVRMPALTVDAVSLGSAPLRGGSGMIPAAQRAFVAQQHPEGRITFIDLDSGAPRTLTGFELSSRVSQ